MSPPRRPALTADPLYGHGLCLFPVAVPACGTGTAAAPLPVLGPWAAPRHGKVRLARRSEARPAKRPAPDMRATPAGPLNATTSTVTPYSDCSIRGRADRTAGLAAPRLPLAAFSSAASHPGWLPPRPCQGLPGSPLPDPAPYPRGLQIGDMNGSSRVHSTWVVTIREHGGSGGDWSRQRPASPAAGRSADAEAPHGLAGDAGDDLEVLIQVQDRQPG